MKFLSGLLLLLVLVSSLGCTHVFSTILAPRYDDRPVSLASINLFDQRREPKAPYPSWKGDWLLRRHRLALIDKNLRLLRPDVVSVRDLMAKRGSSSDSDRHILTKGALNAYDWEINEKSYFDDTGEFSYFGVFASVPARILSDAENSIWPLGLDGSLSIFKLIFDQDPVLLVSIEIPRSSADQDQWYRVILDKIKQVQKETQICPNRTIVAGHLPHRSSWQHHRQMMVELGLIDSANGFCEIASECQTTTNLNPLVDVLASNSSAQRANRILIPNSSIVISSKRIFDKSYLDAETRKVVSRYGMDKLSALLEYGWMSKFQLSKCRESKQN